MSKFIFSVIAFASLTNSAFAFCTSKNAEQAIRAALKQGALTEGAKVANAHFAKFMNAPQTVLEYAVVFDLVEKDSTRTKTFIHFDIDAEDASCKILSTSIAQTMDDL
jgi:hypothetical protein